MNKKHKALFSLFAAGIISLFTLSIFPQNTGFGESRQLQTFVPKDVMQNYIDVLSLPINERSKVISEFSANDKANIFRFHLAFQFAKRQNLNKAQKDLILETLSKVTPDSYSRENVEKRSIAQQEATLLQQKAKTNFSKQEGFEIFANIGGGKEDLAILQKYVEVSSLLGSTERKQHYQAITPQEKSNLWRVQMSLAFIMSLELSKIQKEFILRAIDFANPQIFEDSNINLGNQEDLISVQELERQAVNLFSKDLGIKIFGVIGEAIPCTVSKSEEITKSVEAGRDCSCSQGSEFTCLSPICYYCSLYTSECGRTREGCGFWWRYECNSVCRICR